MTHMGQYRVALEHDARQAKTSLEVDADTAPAARALAEAIAIGFRAVRARKVT